MKEFFEDVAIKALDIIEWLGECFNQGRELSEKPEEKEFFDRLYGGLAFIGAASIVAMIIKVVVLLIKIPCYIAKRIFK